MLGAMYGTAILSLRSRVRGRLAAPRDRLCTAVVSGCHATARGGCYAERIREGGQGILQVDGSAGLCQKGSGPDGQDGFGASSLGQIPAAPDRQSQTE
ncbi:hypothetical protein ATO3_14065 [Marinibacterium profundimaris]|uniref:Uncharacterized protein n=1 Tax=Marinibacterium profundimaris TaxID=1679460 RepID=A0A225NKH8_9RHOB|nr:hypothetical protein ATO3_14065 [Marinibacterium profundimaris]